MGFRLCYKGQSGITSAKLLDRRPVHWSGARETQLKIGFTCSAAVPPQHAQQHPQHHQHCRHPNLLSPSAGSRQSLDCTYFQNILENQNVTISLAAIAQESLVGNSPRPCNVQELAANGLLLHVGTRSGEKDKITASNPIPSDWHPGPALTIAWL